MQLDEYQRLALRTAPINTENSMGHDLVHATLGLVTEAAEIADVLKKKHAYDKEVDVVVNMKEELGDVPWYCAFMARALGINLSDAASVNIDKLMVRYPEKFSKEAALNRNLDAERQVLEKC